jgi:hypothetical protein
MLVQMWGVSGVFVKEISLKEGSSEEVLPLPLNTRI